MEGSAPEEPSDMPKNKPKKKGTKTKKSNACKSSLLSGITPEKCPLDFSTPETLLSSLLAPACTLLEFFDKYWEKQPLHIPLSTRDCGDAAQSSNVQGYFAKLFNRDVLNCIIEEYKLQYKVDLNACRYVGGRRENATLLEDQCIELEKINQLLDLHHMTMQFHQPQRFHDEIWKIQERMECYFGCLVGSNVYMTPEGTQGLAPHCDDVEVFVLQTEGKKTWKLYTPLKNLVRECSGDLKPHTIDKLELIMEVTLNPGDILYFPRGTVHEAKVAKGAGHSTHLTISTFQNHCWGDYLVSTFPSLVDHCTDKTEGLRRGMPLRYSEKVSLKAFRDQVLEMLDIARDAIVQNPQNFETASAMSCDFFANRLPPFGCQKEPVGKLPTLKSLVRFVYPDHVLISRGKGLYDDPEPLEDDEKDLLKEEEDDDSDVVGSAATNSVYVYHSLCNARRKHMVGEPKTHPNGLRFDVACLESLQTLKKSGNNFISVEHLKLPAHQGLDMLIGLWAEALVECQD